MEQINVTEIKLKAAKLPRRHTPYEGLKVVFCPLCNYRFFHPTLIDQSWFRHLGYWCPDCGLVFVFYWSEGISQYGNVIKCAVSKTNLKTALKDLKTYFKFWENY